MNGLIRHTIFSSRDNDPTTSIFLSYANYKVTQQLKADLEQRGFSILIDQDGLRPGTSDWEEAIRTVIRSAGAAIYIASPVACSAPFVKLFRSSWLNKG